MIFFKSFYNLHCYFFTVSRNILNLNLNQIVSHKYQQAIGFKIKNQLTDLLFAFQYLLFEIS
ncbi:MAG: hypothetical protein BA867_01570 [Desulfobacterales bacterium S5133MH16]|nr:MAG: hypothetical protein BA867_01570 [Desulfobacterales bacterium S5133MH16]